MRELKQSTAANVIIFMADSTDHITGKTGLTLTVTLSKDGGAFNSISPTVTERTSGWYNIALTASHTDTLGDCVVRATSTGADASERVFNVVANVEADSYGIVNNGTYGNAQLVRTSALPANFSAMSITAAGLVDITQAAADKVWGTATRILTDKTGYALSAAGVAAILDGVVEGGLTLRQIMRINLAALAGISSGGGTATLIFKGVDGTTTRITATVDADGNRTAITVNGA